MIQVVILVALVLTISHGFQGVGRGKRAVSSLLMSESTVQRPASPKAYRIFNAASLPELLNPISEEEAKSLDKVQEVLKKAGKCGMICISP